MLGEVPGERGRVACVQGVAAQVPRPVRPHDRLGGGAVDVGQLHPVTAGFG